MVLAINVSLHSYAYAVNSIINIFLYFDMSAMAEITKYS